MEQFSLEKYLRLKKEGKEPKIVTRNGNPVRIICTDRKNLGYGNQIIALNEDVIGHEDALSFNTDGSYFEDRESDLDLFFAPTKHKGWIILWRCNGELASGSLVFDSKDEALDWTKAKLFPCWVAKIEWED